MIDDAQHQSIIGSLNTWDRQATDKRVAEATALREEFVDRFPISAWPSMPVEDYALGQGNNNVVSYWLEFKTRPVASMSGGSAHKHLIFKRAAENVWQYPKEYTSIEEAWSAVRTVFVEILDLASQGQFDETDDVKVLTGAQAVRAKLLYLYFPDELIPVTSKEAIDHFLQSLGATPLPSVVRANRQLLAALRAVPELAGLSTQELGFFIYHWNDPRTSIKIVKIAPGELAKYWEDCRKKATSVSAGTRWATWRSLRARKPFSRCSVSTFRTTASKRSLVVKPTSYGLFASYNRGIRSSRTAVPPR
jgi:5-methylcytosine-specific restriction protein B